MSWVPPYMRGHGEVEVTCSIDVDDTSYEAQCKRHFTRSGYIFGRGQAGRAEAWQCPRCITEAREAERGTRDD